MSPTWSPTGNLAWRAAWSPAWTGDRRAAWRAAWTYAWPAPVLAVLAAVTPGRTWWIAGFFVLVLVWPATLTIARSFGAGAGFVAASVCAALLVARPILPPIHVVRQPTELDRLFGAPEQRVRHTIELPAGDPTWNRLWQRADRPEPYLWVLVATSADRTGWALDVSTQKGHVATLTPGSAADVDSAAGAAQGGVVHRWHRIPLDGAGLLAGERIDVTVAPRAAGFLPDTVGVVAGYSYRPTGGPRASAFFDGAGWTSEARTLAPPGAPSDRAIGPLRFMIELRLIDPRTRGILMAYY